MTTINAKSIADFAFHPSDGHLYAIGIDSKLYKINPTTGLVTNVGDIGISINANQNPNATWFDRDGYFYFNGSSTTLYRIDLTNPSSPNTTAVTFSTLATPSEGDAARCAQAGITPETTVAKCFAMTDNVAELYSFDLNKNTPPTKVNTTMILNGEGATYRGSENTLYTFHQPLLGVENPSDLYKVEMNGAVTLVNANFLDKQGVGAEFIQYTDGTEQLMVLIRQSHSILEIYDAQDLTNSTPLSSLPLLFPDGSDAYVAGLAVNPVTGEVLVVDDRHDNADFVEIYSVDTNTGQLTLKITLTVPGIDAESLAFAEDGYLYTENDRGNPYPTYNNKIFRIDLSTGNIIAVEENINTVVSGDIEGMSCTGSRIITQLPPITPPTPPTSGCNALSNAINAGLSPQQSLKSGDKLFLGSTSLATKTGHLKAFAVDTSGLPTGSLLYIRDITSNATPLQVQLPFTASATPYIGGDSSNATSKTVYLGDTIGNLYAAPLLQSDGSLQDASTILSAISTVITSLDTSATDPVLYIGSVKASSTNTRYLRAQSDSRLTVFSYDISTTAWHRVWSSYVAGSNKWLNGTATADSNITALPNDAHITDNAYIVADSIVLPITLDPANNACYGLAYYYLFKLTDGHFPSNTFYTTEATPTIIDNPIALGNGQTRTLHLTNLPQSDKLLGLGMADQKLNGNAEINTSFTIKDPFTTGIRSWRELR